MRASSRSCGGSRTRTRSATRTCGSRRIRQSTRSRRRSKMAEPATNADPKDQKRVPQQYDLVADYPPKVTRRSFMMSWAGAAWGTFGLASGVGSFAMLRFMLPNVLFEPPQQYKAGKLEDYEFDKPDERFKQDKKTWIVKLSKDFDGKKKLVALDTTCTHLGCTPN